MQSPLNHHNEMYEKYKKFGYPKYYIPPSLNTKKLQHGKKCGMCWHFSNGMNCGGNNHTRDYVDYCYKSTNQFTEKEVLIVESTPEQATYMQRNMETFFAGNKEEILLHELLTRANYQCECSGKICKHHTGRCDTKHVKDGGKSPFLMQPRDVKKPHSLENDQVMCAKCANANTIAKLSVPKKKRKVQENPNQQTII